MYQMEEQDKTPEEQPVTWRQAERVHSNDRKDDSIIQEKNGCTEQEVIRSF